jgi:hypothetical protein
VGDHSLALFGVACAMFFLASHHLLFHKPTIVSIFSFASFHKRHKKTSTIRKTTTSKANINEKSFLFASHARDH